MNIKPTNKRVILLNPETTEVTTSSGIIIPATREEGLIKKSTVVNIASDCDEIQIGDEVYFNTALKETFGDSILDDKYILVKESDVLAKIIK